MEEDENRSEFKSILHSYLLLLKEDVQKFATRVSILPLSSPKPSVLISLTKRVKEIFSRESVVLELNGPIIVVGDLHGHFLDLIRIFNYYGLKKKYLFLGDIVDRGEFSIETITFIYLLKYFYPDQFFIIRGNHEFETLCSTSGFSEELLLTYRNPYIFKSFIGSFSEMPIAATINKDILCVHGEIGPSWFSIDQARTIKRPIYEFGDEFLDSILWSDPSDQVELFEKSTRGSGFLYGQTAIEDFLDSNNFKYLIRAHECVPDGYSFMFNQRLITVFSASNYCGAVSNLSATLEISQNGDVTPRTQPSLPYLKREWVHFISVCPSSSANVFSIY